MSNSSVEKVTATLENTSINTPAGNNEADAAHAASAAEGRRLYIGNLAYNTTEEQLKEFFKGYSIESTSIPTNPRTGRAVGYAFVDLHTKEDAEKAIGELSGKEVLDRKVSVQLARKPGVSTPNSKENDVPNAQGSEKKGGRGGFRFRGGGKRGRGGLKNRGARDNNQAAGTDAAAPTNVPGQTLPLTESKTNENTVDAPKDSAASKEGAAAEGQSGYRSKKKRGPPEDGVPSKTKVMVANLPYELSEERLKELFKDYQPESAKIALRPIPRYMVRKLQARGEPRKGRGFGFVTLANEEMQQKAVAEMNGKTVDGREIAVKVAIDNPKLEEEAKEAEAAKQEGNKVEEKTDADAKATTNGVAAEPAVNDPWQ